MPAAKKQKTAEAAPTPTAGPGGDAAGSKTVFIKNLPWSADEDALGQFFAECGELASVRIARDRDTGRMRGFGHVDFETTEGAANAVAMSGQYMDGRELYIEATEGRAPRKFCYKKLDKITIIW